MRLGQVGKSNLLSVQGPGAALASALGASISALSWCWYQSQVQLGISWPHILACFKLSSYLEEVGVLRKWVASIPF